MILIIFIDKGGGRSSYVSWDTNHELFGLLNYFIKHTIEYYLQHQKFEKIENNKAKIENIEYVYVPANRFLLKNNVINLIDNGDRFHIKKFNENMADFKTAWFVFSLDDLSKLQFPQYTYGSSVVGYFYNCVSNDVNYNSLNFLSINLSLDKTIRKYLNKGNLYFDRVLSDNTINANSFISLNKVRFLTENAWHGPNISVSGNLKSLKKVNGGVYFCGALLKRNGIKQYRKQCSLDGHSYDIVEKIKTSLLSFEDIQVILLTDPDRIKQIYLSITQRDKEILELKELIKNKIAINQKITQKQDENVNIERKVKIKKKISLKSFLSLLYRNENVK